MRGSVAVLAAVALAAGCGSEKPWTAGRNVFTGGDDKCASAVSPDKAETLFICQESNGTETCSYFRYWEAGAETSFDGDCKNARSAVVNAELLARVASSATSRRRADRREVAGRTADRHERHDHLDD